MSRLAIATSLALAMLAAPAYAQRANQGEDESAALVNVGRAALRANNLDEAAKALDQAIALNPRRVDAYVLRAAVYSTRKQYAEAVALMKRAQAMVPADVEVLASLGSNLVLAGDRDAGIAMLQDVVNREPRRFAAQLFLAHHWHAAGRWPEAISAFEAYFASRPDELAPEDADHRVELADSYLRARKPDKALPLFETSLRDSKSDLRARLGVVWATAAIDCRKAKPMLHDLEVIADAHPEIWLVDGQCALALGDPAVALALGRRYLEKTGDRPSMDKAPAASGHALVGEAHAARGNLGDARRELETARTLEPTKRRWTVRLASVLRRGDHASDALEALTKLGPPDRASDDRDWWIEYGETLIATGDPNGAASKLGAVVGDLPGDADIRLTLGAAQLQSDHADVAVKSLEEADAIISSARSRKLLAEALTTVAVAKLASNDASNAEPLLARAETLDPTALVSRNLGLARLAMGKAGDAVGPLDRAAKLEPTPIAIMLTARARAQSGDVAGARPLYERALAADRDNPVEVALDWAASEVAGGDPAVAVTALDKTAAVAKSGPLAQRHKLALATARHAAGLAALKAGNGGKAVELLRAASTVDNSLSVRCDLAVATVVAGDPNTALAALKSITGQTCPFPPPADTQAAPILAAFTEGLNPRRAGKALDRLTSLGGKSTGPAAVLLGTAIRVVALNAAQDAYRNNQLPAARRYLAQARSAAARIGNDEVAHNLAVLDLADGHADAAIAQLERVAAKVPEALINLGIAYERKGDNAKALDAWRRARKLNVRFPDLAGWIEAKERIYGGEP